MIDGGPDILANFRASLAASEPPAGTSVALAALWWTAKRDWNRAHALVQGDGGKDAAWVHAHLHRVEGDLANAAYWYRRAGRDPSTAELDAEWAAIAAQLLDRADQPLDGIKPPSVPLVGNHKA